MQSDFLEFVQSNNFKSTFAPEELKLNTLINSIWEKTQICLSSQEMAKMNKELHEKDSTAGYMFSNDQGQFLSRRIGEAEITLMMTVYGMKMEK
jgi:hypothetical protein